MTKYVFGFAMRHAPHTTLKNLSQYHTLFSKKTTHVEVGEWGRVEYSGSDPYQLLGITKNFYNCLGGYLSASKTQGDDVIHHKALIHFNERDNSAEALEDMIGHFVGLHSQGWQIGEAILVRNSICSSDQTGWVTRAKQTEAMEYFDSVTKIHNFPWKTMWVSESGFVVTQNATLVEKSSFMEKILANLTPEQLQDMLQKSQIKFSEHEHTR